MGSAPSAKKRRAAKKKRNVSKHIAKANEEQVKLQKAQNSEAVSPALAKAEEDLKETSAVVDAFPTNNNQHVKDVREAANYLTLWKIRDTGSNAWKFNKNTQSWLIRHCYESDKVSKSTFSVLLDYLGGLQGADAKTRIVEEATRRALRYKQYAGEQPDGDDDKIEETNNNKTVVKFSEDTKAEAPKKAGTRNERKAAAVAADEETRWLNLSDHDKRKEYKRARKILETLRA